MLPTAPDTAATEDRVSLRLRLIAPLQSWGVSSLFDTRDTAHEPSRSGVIGLMAGALGRDRTEDISDLSRLSFGVRVDMPGTLLRDYQTAQARDGKSNDAQVARYYLQDAAFWVALEGDADLLAQVARALQDPVFPTSLGRRNCQPSVPLLSPADGDGPLPGVPLLSALREAPSLRRPAFWDTLERWQGHDQQTLYRLVLDRRLVPVDERGPWQPSRQQDVPVAPFSERCFRMRDILSRSVPLTLIPDPFLHRHALKTEPALETA